jgi:uncharacterized membrane protein YkoI
MKKWMAIPALAGAVVIGGVGIAQAANTTNTSNVKSPIEVHTNLLTTEEVKEKAIEAVGGKVTDIELDLEKSRYIYEVEVQSNGFEFDLDIDGETGKVLRTEKDSWDDDDYDDHYDDNVIVTDGKFITKEAAVEIALKQAKGKVTSVELDEDDGRVHYEIEIRKGNVEYDLEIDAITGKVLEIDVDHEDD